MAGAPPDDATRLRETFNEIRGLHEWPFRASVLTAIIVGVVFPVGVQALLISSLTK